jgi:hypothetical protein
MNGSGVIQKLNLPPRINAYLFVGLSLTLIGIVAMLLSLHDHAHKEYKPNEPVQWREPFKAKLSQASKSQLSKPIGNSVWSFGYSALMKILWRSRVDERDELVINSETLELLKRASAIVPQATSIEELQRLDFVIKKSIPISAGEELARLLNQYYFYEQEEKTALQVLNSSKGQQKRVLLASAELESEERQVRYFGRDVAIKLFSKNNTTQNYLNARSSIKLSEILTATQKEERLDQLQNAYQLSLQD